MEVIVSRVNALRMTKCCTPLYQNKKLFCFRNVADTKPNASYISLNGMFNSMRYEKEKMQRLRHDSVFEVNLM